MKQRIITAFLALILFIPLTLYGDWPFSIFVYLIASIGLWELLRMKETQKYLFPTLLSIVMLWIILAPISISESFTWFNKSEIIMIFVLILLSYTVLKKNKFTFDDAGFILLATLYVGMGFFYFLETRHSINGLVTMLYALFIVWATDTGAYFFGKAFGKHKLWPKISPNKTVEGAVGGIILAVIIAIVFHLVHPFNYTLVTIIGVTILASIFGQIGDLVESAFKRHFQVKDSGTILPGHGGILDRFDSIMFVFPLLHFIQFIS